MKRTLPEEDFQRAFHDLAQRYGREAIFYYAPKIERKTTMHAQTELDIALTALFAAPSNPEARRAARQAALSSSAQDAQMTEEEMFAEFCRIYRECPDDKKAILLMRAELLADVLTED